MLMIHFMRHFYRVRFSWKNGMKFLLFIQKSKIRMIMLNTQFLPIIIEMVSMKKLIQVVVNYLLLPFVKWEGMRLHVLSMQGLILFLLITQWHCFYADVMNSHIKYQPAAILRKKIIYAGFAV